MDNVREQIRRMTDGEDVSELGERLAPDHSDLPPRVPGATLHSPEAIEKRWRLVEDAGDGGAKASLLTPQAAAEAEAYAGSIENYIGTLRVPVGLAGPLRVNGLHAKGDYYIPLATTEAVLVASYHRGCRLISEAGGCASLLLMEGVSRSPGFEFASLREAGEFVRWIGMNFDPIKGAAEATTRHGELRDVRVNVEGNHVYLFFEYLTGDAAGQNIATIATKAACDFILESSPVRAHLYFVEANMSGDKKASAQSFQSVRGKKVSAEVRLPADLLRKRLHCDAAGMEAYWRMSAMGGVMSGTIGVHGHYANGLAALYLATGQDVACVAESSVGVTRFQACGDGSLYAAVTLPNLIVGTVGGGTRLPTQHASLEILKLAGDGHAQALAEVCAGLALAGELSIIGALVADEFSRAHQKRTRDHGRG